MSFSLYVCINRCFVSQFNFFIKIGLNWENLVHIKAEVAISSTEHWLTTWELIMIFLSDFFWVTSIETKLPSMWIFVSVSLDSSTSLGLLFFNIIILKFPVFFFSLYMLLSSFLKIRKALGLLSVSSVSLHSMRGVVGNTLQGIAMNVGKSGLLTNSSCLWNMVILCAANRNVNHNIK